MSYKATKAVMKLDCTPHPQEEALKAAFCEADSGVGEAVKEARLAGISWPNIIALLSQFGPQFVAMIQAIIAALKTTPPGVKPPVPLSDQDKAEAAGYPWPPIDPDNLKKPEKVPYE